MKHFIFIMICVFASLNVFAQNTIRRNTSENQRSCTNVRSNKSTGANSNVMGVGMYGSLKGYHKITTEQGLTYEGNWEYGNVRGTCTSSDGRIKSEGYFVQGDLEGKGKWYIDGQLYFDGNFHRAEPSGEGTYYGLGAPVYSSNWYGNFCADGVTFKMSENETFVGDIKNQVPWSGIVYSNNGNYRFWYDESAHTWKKEPLN